MIKKKIKVYYWIGKINFGDMLNPYLISKLSNRKVVYKDNYFGFYSFIWHLKEYILLNEFSKLKRICFPWEKVLLCIGSILGVSGKNNIVWGSGFMNEKDECRGGKIYAVRGKYSKMKLEKLGIKCPDVLGDPALLLPLIVKPSEYKKYEIGIIPHWKETELFQKKYSSKYKVIDLNTNNIEYVICEITSCKKILSSSLHGIIVAHAYNVPAIWIKEGYIDTDGFKFKDYFSSVLIKEYDGFTNYNEILEKNEIENFFESNKLISLPQTSLHKIQKKLLDNAPFEISVSIKNKLNNY